MNYRLFSILYQESLESTDYESFMTTHLKQAWLTEYTNIHPATTILYEIYQLSHRTLTELYGHAGMSQTKFAISYNIPISKVKDWDTGVLTAPDFLKMLVAYTIFMENDSRSSI